MLLRIRTFLALTVLSSALLSCGEQESVVTNSAEPVAVSAAITEIRAIERWYDVQQVLAGREIFQENCASCHGDRAQGTVEDWRARLEDGSFPPPPLNGSAHAWHHPQEILLSVIDYGGESLGGKMPAFIDVLDQDEKLAAIAYFQEFWSDDIYQQWMQMGGTN